MPKKKSKLPLSKTHPKLAKEADGWDPSLVTAGSQKRVLWVCKKGHEFKAYIYSRTSRGDGCPFCAGRKVLPGFNDLITTHPAIAKESHGWDPRTYSSGSNRKVSWKCRFGHHWTATINNRTGNNSGCPVCTNKVTQSGFNDLATTNPEVAAKAFGWDPTKFTSGSGRSMKWKCHLNHLFTATINSQVRKNGCPVCSNRRLVVGVNDLFTTHPAIAKQAYLWDPKESIAGSSKKRAWKCSKDHVWEVSPEVRTQRGSGCPYCSNNKVMTGFNDLQTLFPEIAKQANGWDPNTVIPGSNARRQWICELGHTWQISPDQRTGKAKSGCPYCSNKKLLIGFNDLATRFPDLAREADGWDPTSIISGHKKRSWKCRNGHKWASDVLSRTTMKVGCPSCAKHGFDPNMDGYLYFLQHLNWGMLQIGITNSPKQRLRDHELLRWEVLELRGPMNGPLAQQWETAILRMLKAKGADLSNENIAGKFDGYSEAWSKTTFPVKSIKELMRLTEEFEDSNLR